MALNPTAQEKPRRLAPAPCARFSIVPESRNRIIADKQLKQDQLFIRTQTCPFVYTWSVAVFVLRKAVNCLVTEAVWPAV